MPLRGDPAYLCAFLNLAKMNLRWWLRLLAAGLATGSAVEAVAQLPPPDLLLTEPHPAVLSVGPVDLHVRASALAFYDDNISLYEQRTVSGGITTGRREPPLGDDFIFVFAPGF